jgi:uncharacterized protein
MYSFTKMLFNWTVDKTLCSRANWNYRLFCCPISPKRFLAFYHHSIKGNGKYGCPIFNVKLTDLPIEWGKQSLFPFDHESPNISGALVEKTDMIPNGNNTVVYFETEDCITEEKRIEAAGGKIVRPKMPIGEFGFVSIFIDSEGNTIGLHSRT